MANLHMARQHESLTAYENSYDTTPLSPKYGPHETVVDLGCSFGSFAYDDAVDPRRPHPLHRCCHNPVETPGERHHCDRCGGDYCTIHAEPAAHDCWHIILPT